MKNFFRHTAISCFLFSASYLCLPTASFAAIAPVESSTLSNQSTLLVRRDQIAPRVAISLLVRAGATHENQANAGWRQVLTAAILRATELETSEAAKSDAKIARFADWQSQLEKWGGDIGATVDDDAIEFWITGDSAHSAELLRILLQMVSQPRLADEDFTAARRRVLTLQSRAGSGVAARATQAISQRLYRDAKDAPLAYALPAFGSFESLSSLTNEQLREWHAQFFVPSRFIVAATGDVNADALKSELNRIESTPDAAAPSILETSPKFGALDVNSPPLVVRQMGDGGAWVFAAFRTPAPRAMSPAENAAMEVLAAALEGSALARLPRRLLGETDKPFNPGLESNALAAQTATQWTTRSFAGELTVFAQTGPQNVEGVKNALLDEVRKLSEAPLSATELQRAKDFARGQWAVKRSTLRERAFGAALAALHLPTPDSQWPQQLQAVSAADIQKVAQKYLRNYAIVLIMPEE